MPGWPRGCRLGVPGTRQDPLGTKKGDFALLAGWLGRKAEVSLGCGAASSPRALREKGQGQEMLLPCSQ